MNAAVDLWHQTAIHVPMTTGVSEPAETAAEKVRNVYIYARSPSIPIDRETSTINQLLKLIIECSDENWDGYGAAAISEGALNNVLKIIALLSEDIPAPDICPEPDGDVALEWYGNNNSTFSLSVSDTELLHYAAIFPDQHQANGTEDLSEECKEVIESFIRRTLQNTSAQRP